MKQRPSTYVYFFEAIGTDRIKIGKAADVQRRFQDIKVCCPVELRILASTTLYTERFLHQKFAHLRCTGEWFSATQELRDFILRVANPEPGDRAFYFRPIDDVLEKVHRQERNVTEA